MKSKNFVEVTYNMCTQYGDKFTTTIEYMYDTVSKMTNRQLESVWLPQLDYGIALYLMNELGIYEAALRGYYVINFWAVEDIKVAYKVVNAYKAKLQLDKDFDT